VCSTHTWPPLLRIAPQCPVLARGQPVAAAGTRRQGRAPRGQQQQQQQQQQQHQQHQQHCSHYQRSCTVCSKILVGKGCATFVQSYGNGNCHCKCCRGVGISLSKGPQRLPGRAPSCMWRTKLGTGLPASMQNRRKSLWIPSSNSRVSFTACL